MGSQKPDIQSLIHFKICIFFFVFEASKMVGFKARKAGCFSTKIRFNLA